MNIVKNQAKKAFLFSNMIYEVRSNNGWMLFRQKKKKEKDKKRKVELNQPREIPLIYVRMIWELNKIKYD